MEERKDKIIPRINIRKIYDRFNAPVTAIDCGTKCAPHNPSGLPFCCDICQAVPAVYRQEWEYLQPNTDLWHEWRGDECSTDPASPEDLRAQTPEHMLLLACKGPAHCQRDFRAVSCRQFPFFPYITSDDRFIGLAYEWAFESTGWVISNLREVTDTYRREFIQTYDSLFDRWEEEFDSYAILSEQMRERFAALKRRIPILSVDLLPEEDAPDPAPNPEKVVGELEESSQMRRLLKGLGPQDRAAVVLRYWYDFSEDEIAKTLSLTVSAVKSRLHRARKELAQSWQETQANNALPDRRKYESPAL